MLNFQHRLASVSPSRAFPLTLRPSLSLLIHSFVNDSFICVPPCISIPTGLIASPVPFDNCFLCSQPNSGVDVIFFLKHPGGFFPSLFDREQLSIPFPFSPPIFEIDLGFFFYLMRRTLSLPTPLFTRPCNLYSNTQIALISGSPLPLHGNSASFRGASTRISDSLNFRIALSLPSFRFEFYSYFSRLDRRLPWPKSGVELSPHWGLSVPRMVVLMLFRRTLLETRWQPHRPCASGCQVLYGFSSLVPCVFSLFDPRLDLPYGHHLSLNRTERFSKRGIRYAPLWFPHSFRSALCPSSFKNLSYPLPTNHVQLHAPRSDLSRGRFFPSVRICPSLGRWHSSQVPAPHVAYLVFPGRTVLFPYPPICLC